MPRDNINTTKQTNMKNPFIFGKVISGIEFVNRQNDLKRLKQNIENKTNTILMSPRRWGKSSLVKKVSQQYIKSKKVKFCFIDMFNMGDEQDFYNEFSQQIIKSSSNKIDEWFKTVQTYLSALTPKVSLGIDPQTDFSITLDIQKKTKSFADILNLPEKIATQKKFTLVVCLDEFQNIQKFKNPELLQQRMRSSWQYHQNVIYLIYGSKRNMLSALFEDSSMPFYKFGDNFYLEKIKGNHFQKHIINKFSETEKSIDKHFAKSITTLMEDHPYYVQQFAHIVWNNTENSVNESIIDESIDDIIARNSLLFEREFEKLSKYQINLLRMLIKTKSENYTSSENINEYNLGTSANVIQVIKSLEKKEIIDKFTGKIEFIDPAFKMWLDEVVFR